MPKILRSNAIKIDADDVFRIEVLPPLNIIGIGNDFEECNVEIEEEFIEQESAQELREKIISEANEQAQKIVSNAEALAEEIIEKAKSDAALIAQEAEIKAEREGFDSGFEQGLAEAEGIKEEAQTVLEQAYMERTEIIESIEQDIVELICNILEKLLPNIAKFNHKVILGLIKQGIEGTTITGKVVVHVSKSDYETVVQNKEEILALLATSANLDIVMNLSLDKSDCIIETPFGDIDCSLGEQFNSLKENLCYILESGG